MNCDEFKAKLDDYQGGEMSDVDRYEIDRHISDCDACANIISIDHETLKLLKTIPIVEPSAGFEARMFSEVRRHYAQDRQGQFRFFTGFATAMAASLAIWVATVVIEPIETINNSSIVEMSINQVQPVTLMLESRSELQQVQLDIRLPKNVELEGYPGQQQLSWNTELRKGVNMLELPVVVNTPGDSEIIAQVTYGNQVKTVRIALKATTLNNGVMQMTLSDAGYTS